VGHLERCLVTKGWNSHVPDAIHQHQHYLIGISWWLHLLRLLLLLLGLQGEQYTCWVLLTSAAASRHRRYRKSIRVKFYSSLTL
jgi:hypothetical protein